MKKKFISLQAIALLSLGTSASAVTIIQNDNLTSRQALSQQNNNVTFTFDPGTSGGDSMWVLESLGILVDGFFLAPTATISGGDLASAFQATGNNVNGGSNQDLIFNFTGTPEADRTLTAGESYTVTLNAGTPGVSVGGVYARGSTGAPTTGNADADVQDGNAFAPFVTIEANPIAPAIPEPSSTLLMAFAACLGFARRKR